MPTIAHILVGGKHAHISLNLFRLDYPADLHLLGILNWQKYLMSQTHLSLMILRSLLHLI